MRYFEDLAIGQAMVAGEYALHEDEIIAFARQWDPQPFHTDPQAAQLTPMGGLTASSAHTYAITAKLLATVSPPIAGIASLKHEFEIPHAARPGDVLSLSLTIVDKRVSSSKPDRGLVTTVAELHTRNGKAVLRLRSLLMVHCRPAE